MELFNKSFTKVVNLKVFFINPGKVLPKLSESSKENKADTSYPNKMFNGNFNKNMFNKEFNNYKKEQQQKLGKNLVKYEEPKIDISYKINVGIARPI